MTFFMFAFSELNGSMDDMTHVILFSLFHHKLFLMPIYFVCFYKCDCLPLVVLFLVDIHRLGKLLSGSGQIEEEGGWSISRLSWWIIAGRSDWSCNNIQSTWFNKKAKDTATNGMFNLICFFCFLFTFNLFWWEFICKYMSTLCVIHCVERYWLISTKFSSIIWILQIPYGIGNEKQK